MVGYGWDFLVVEFGLGYFVEFVGVYGGVEYYFVKDVIAAGETQRGLGFGSVFCCAVAVLF